MKNYIFSLALQSIDIQQVWDGVTVFCVQSKIGLPNGAEHCLEYGECF